MSSSTRRSTRASSAGALETAAVKEGGGAGAPGGQAGSRRCQKVITAERQTAPGRGLDSSIFRPNAAPSARKPMHRKSNREKPPVCGGNFGFVPETRPGHVD